MRTKTINRIIFFLLIVFMVAGLGACENKTEKYQQAVESGDSAMNAINYEAAINYYEHAKNIKPQEAYPEQQINKAKDLQLEKERDLEYRKHLNLANQFYNNQNYEEAIQEYYAALEVRPHDEYAIMQLEKAENLLAEQKKMEEAMKNPYHIVVGSFEKRSNAEKLQQELLNDGYNSHLAPRFGGEYTAVTLYSYPDLHAAWNHLDEVYEMQRFQEVDPWILKYSLSDE